LLQCWQLLLILLILLLLLLLLLLLVVQLMQAGVSAEEFEHTIADPELLMEVRSIRVHCSQWLHRYLVDVTHAAHTAYAQRYSLLAVLPTLSYAGRCGTTKYT
jgi:ABC-type sulfate transport system permease component